jgi:hypothetical protein
LNKISNKQKYLDIGNAYLRIFNKGQQISQKEGFDLLLAVVP